MDLKQLLRTAIQETSALAELHKRNILRQTTRPPYMAPEQTGKMNRPVDHRTDLYSLGITFYEMLAGQFPFDAADALEWAHCHIARAPRPLAEAAPGTPQVIADLVMKLLAK